MRSKNISGREAASAVDEFFKEQPILPVEQEATEEPVPSLSLSEASGVPMSAGSTTHPSVLRDYVRELKQEFDDQEKEGKI
jgi:hypothetical protein